jgi:hypothetical protein
MNALQTKPVTTDEAVRCLNNMDAGDPDVSHGVADKIILERLEAMGESELVQAYNDARDRCGFWYA